MPKAMKIRPKNLQPKQVEICFHSVPKSTSERFKPALQKTFESVAPSKIKVLKPYGEIRLDVHFVSELKIKQINRRFRKKNKPTDVLSFSNVERKPFPPGVYLTLGEIVICRTYAKRLKQDLTTLVVHGLLHIFGYDHETNLKDAKKMFALQGAILESLQPDPSSKHGRQGKPSPKKPSQRR